MLNVRTVRTAVARVCPAATTMSAACLAWPGVTTAGRSRKRMQWSSATSWSHHGALGAPLACSALAAWRLDTMATPTAHVLGQAVLAEGMLSSNRPLCARVGDVLVRRANTNWFVQRHRCP